MAKQRKIRWDRVTVCSALLLGTVFLMGSCVQHCTRTDNPESSASGSPLEPLGDSSRSAQSSESGSGTVESQQVSEPEQPVLPAGYQYIQQSPDTVYAGNLILVDQDHPCRVAREDLDLIQIVYATDRPDCYQLSYPKYTYFNRTALTKFNQLMTAFYSVTQNKDIMFNYGYLEADKEKANPESATGLDIQLHLHKASGEFAYVTNIQPYSWIFAHMESYGYILRYPEDKQDKTGQKGGYTAIRYVGAPHAAYMKDNNLCLEEYLELLKQNYTFGQGMLEYSSNEQKYNIYYVPAAAAGDTDLPVPDGLAYEVSGNNTDGFIVTVFLK